MWGMSVAMDIGWFLTGEALQQQVLADASGLCGAWLNGGQGGSKHCNLADAEIDVTPANKGQDKSRNGDEFDWNKLQFPIFIVLLVLLIICIIAFQFGINQEPKYSQ